MVVGAGEEPPPPQAVSASTPLRAVASALAPLHRQRCTAPGWADGIMHLTGMGILASSEVVLEVKQEGLSPTPLPLTRHRHRTTPVG